MTTQEKQLTVQERAQQALTIEHTEEQLAELAGKSADLVEIKDTADYELVKRSALVLRDARIEIEKAGKSARDDANTFAKAVIQEERRLIAIVAPEETRLKDLRKVEDGKVAQKLADEKAREDARLKEIGERIQQIAGSAEGLLNADSETITGRLEAVKDIRPTEDYFAERAEEARAARLTAIDTLERALETRLALEEQLVEQARVAEEQARIAAEQAERDAEIERKAEEQRKAAAAAEAERLEEARQVREAREAEDLKRRQAQEAEDKKRRDAQEAEDQKRREAEEARLAEERAEAKRIRDEKEQLEAEARAREEEERKAAEAEAERQRIEAARPDVDKLLIFAEWLDRIEPPEVDDEACARQVEITMDLISDTANALFVAATAMQED